MDRTIILDCQTNNGTLNCVDCIAYKECKIRKTVKNQRQIQTAKRIQVVTVKEKAENLACCIQI